MYQRTYVSVIRAVALSALALLVMTPQVAAGNNDIDSGYVHFGVDGAVCEADVTAAGPFDRGANGFYITAELKVVAETSSEKDTWVGDMEVSITKAPILGYTGFVNLDQHIIEDTYGQSDDGVSKQLSVWVPASMHGGINGDYTFLVKLSGTHVTSPWDEQSAPQSPSVPEPIVEADCVASGTFVVHWSDVN